MILRTEPIQYGDDAAAALADALRRRVEGEVRFDAGSRAVYATDASNYRHPPIGVVLPRSTDDVVETVAVCHEHQAPIVMRGGGTALAGQTVNTAVVIDCSKYVNRILDLDYEGRRARVQPGVIFDAVRTRAEQHGLTLAFDTSTHDRATIGGMLANNSCGVHSVLAQMEGHGSGRAADNVDELEIVTYDGCRMRVGATGEDELDAIIREGGRRSEIYGRLKALRDRYADLIRERYPDIPRRVSGYNLTQLLPEKNFHLARALVGSEGTLATFLEATVALVDSPAARTLLVLGYEDVYATGDHTAEVLAERPVGLEALDGRLIENMKRKGLRAEETALLPEGGGWLLAEFGGATPEEAEANARRVMDRLTADGGPSMRLFTDKEEQESVWSVRESGLGATAYVPGHADQWPGWEDSAVPVEKVGDYLRDLRSLFHRYGYEAALYGHFGQGCIHCRIDFDLRGGEGVRTWRRFLDDAADLVVRYGGSLSGEHGDGQARAELLPKMYGQEIVQAFRELKGIFDPDNRMNPGKIVDPYPMDANLRVGPHDRLREVKTHFGYPDDGGSFRRAVMRCVGVGKCRRHGGGGVMCPSFMATHEEEHATRGRSRALYEMLHGGIIDDGWKSGAVRDSLDLCLACKGCKNDCPVNVDMATYKAEFMAHHYKGRLRPRSAYSMGLIYWWSRAASVMPGVVNAATRAPGLGPLLKAAGGIHQDRSLPAYAEQTFRSWFAGRGEGRPGGRPVVLFPDTFNNFFTPGVGAAAVEVLEGLGYSVRLPGRILCCGRPLYDKGMLNTAKSLLRQIMNILEPELDDDTWIVGLEPACVSALRDELVNLFPNDERANRVAKRTLFLSELLAKEQDRIELPRLARRAMVHLHCHHHAVLDTPAERTILKKLELDIDLLDSGCCGMAGSFGFEQEHYEVAMRCGERVLLPAVREAPKDKLIISNGFSCREQIAQSTDRRALHLAQVLHMAMHERGGTGEAYPERRRLEVAGLQG